MKVQCENTTVLEKAGIEAYLCGVGRISWELLHLLVVVVVVVGCVGEVVVGPVQVRVTLRIFIDDLIFWPTVWLID